MKIRYSLYWLALGSIGILIHWIIIKFLYHKLEQATVTDPCKIVVIKPEPESDHSGIQCKSCGAPLDIKKIGVFDFVYRVQCDYCRNINTL